jgi:hypothetical protein
MKDKGRLTGIVRFICGVFTVLLLVSTGWAQNTLEVSDSSLTFTAIRRGDSPDPQNVAVTSAVTERIDFTIKVQAIQPSDSSWLAISLQHGTTPARLRISVDQRDMAAGDYEASVIVQSGSQSIPIDVRLTVVESPPVLRVAPASLRFSAGVSDDPTRLLFIRNAGGGDLSYSVTVAAGSEWLSVTPATGVTAPNQPSLIRVTANRDSAKPADYTEPEIAQEAVGSERLQVSEQSLRQRLRQKGLLASIDAGRGMVQVRRTLEGRPRQVLHFKGQRFSRAQGCRILTVDSHICQLIYPQTRHDIGQWHHSFNLHGLQRLQKREKGFGDRR